MVRAADLLNPVKGLIFRITHVLNVPWILEHGLHCRHSAVLDPSFVESGNRDLIDRRAHRPLAMEAGGTLGDYIPFYFTPWSPMLYNIRTGYQGVPRRTMAEIVILVSSIPRLDEIGVPYLISDRHAYLEFARFAVDASGLSMIDWQLLRSRDFQRDREEPERFERYQAEALVYRHLPCEGLLGIACHDEAQRIVLADLLRDRGVRLKLRVVRNMFF